MRLDDERRTGSDGSRQELADVQRVAIMPGALRIETRTVSRARNIASSRLAHLSYSFGLAAEGFHFDGFGYQRSVFKAETELSCMRHYECARHFIRRCERHGERSIATRVTHIYGTCCYYIAAT